MVFDVHPPSEVQLVLDVLDTSLPLIVTLPVACMAGKLCSFPVIEKLPLPATAVIICSLPPIAIVAVAGTRAEGFCCSDPFIVTLVVPPVVALLTVFHCTMPLICTLPLPEVAA